MTSILLTTLGLGTLGLGLGAGQTLSTDYTRDRSLTVSVRCTSETEVTASETTIDGEAVDRPAGGGSSQERSYSYTDTVLAEKDGAPRKVKRAFGEVGGSSTRPSRDGGDSTMEIESAFSDAIVVIDATGDEQKVEVLEGKLEDEQLAALVPTLLLDRLLPEGEVEAGASWELAGTDFLAALGHDLELQLFRRPAPEGGEGERGGRGGRGGMGGPGGGGVLSIPADAEWDAKAKLTEETEEVDGVECAVIELTAEVSGELPEPTFGGRGRDRAFALEGPARANTFEAEFKGRLLWSVAEARPVRLALEGKIETVRDMERETERGVFKSHSEQVQKVDLTVDVTTGPKGE